MGNYAVRPALRAQLTADRIAAVGRAEFGAAARAGDAVSIEYGALESLVASSRGGQLVVDVRMNPKVPNDVAAETIRRYNRFLEALTGYTAKERSKKAQQAARKGAP